MAEKAIPGTATTHGPIDTAPQGPPEPPERGGNLQDRLEKLETWAESVSGALVQMDTQLNAISEVLTVLVTGVPGSEEGEDA